MMIEEKEIYNKEYFSKLDKELSKDIKKKR